MSKWVLKTDEKPHPDEPGHYAVMFPGDSETEGMHVFYAYPDYMGFAEWIYSTEVFDVDPTDDEDIPNGYWNTSEGEADDVFAWYGPLDIPEFKS